MTKFTEKLEFLLSFIETSVVPVTIAFWSIWIGNEAVKCIFSKKIF